MSASPVIDFCYIPSPAQLLAFPRTRHCKQCNTPIPAKRLEAMPNATVCVLCLSVAGDVAPIKRFDDGGEEIYFTENTILDESISRSNNMTWSRVWSDVEIATEFGAMFGAVDLATAVKDQESSNRLDREQE